MDDDDHVQKNKISLTCDSCSHALKRCVVYPCRSIVYDDNDPLRHAHLCGLCEKCNKIKQIYFVNDTRVYFPPDCIYKLELYNSKNTLSLQDSCYTNKIIIRPNQ